MVTTRIVITASVAFNFGYDVEELEQECEVLVVFVFQSFHVADDEIKDADFVLGLFVVVESGDFIEDNQRVFILFCASGNVRVREVAQQASAVSQILDECLGQA